MTNIPQIICFLTAKAGERISQSFHCTDVSAWMRFKIVSSDSMRLQMNFCIYLQFVFFFSRGFKCLKAALCFKDWSVLSPPKQCNGKLYSIIALSGAHLIKDISNMLMLMENHLSCLAVRSYRYFLHLFSYTKSVYCWRTQVFNPWSVLPAKYQKWRGDIGTQQRLRPLFDWGNKLSCVQVGGQQDPITARPQPLSSQKMEGIRGGKERNEKEEMMAEKMRKGGKVKGRIDIREESAVFGLIEKERGKGQKGD